MIVTKTDDHTSEVLDALESGKERVLEMIGIKAEKYAKALCPVDTSNLRNSISHMTDSDTVYIGTDVEYAPYVELGHSQEPGRYVPAIGRQLVRDFVPPKPYLKPAVVDHTREYQMIIRAELGK